MWFPRWHSANAGDARIAGSIPGSGRSPGGGNGNLFQYRCLEKPMDGGAWQATIHGVAKNQTQLRGMTHTHTHRGEICPETKERGGKKSCY